MNFQIPPAGSIELALDELEVLPATIKGGQISELASIGDSGARKAGASGLSADFKAGYTLALQVARVVIGSNTLLELKGIDASELL